MYLGLVNETQRLEIVHSIFTFSYMWVSSERNTKKSCVFKWLLCSQHELHLQCCDPRWNGDETQVSSICPGVGFKMQVRVNTFGSSFLSLNIVIAEK